VASIEISMLARENKRHQCDQTFCEKSAQFCPNIAQNGAIVNKNFCPKTLLAKIWNLFRKILGDLKKCAYMYRLGYIFQKKMRPKAETCTQTAKFSPIRSH
jgi:hypothetical protein